MDSFGFLLIHCSSTLLQKSGGVYQSSSSAEGAAHEFIHRPTFSVLHHLVAPSNQVHAPAISTVQYV